MLIIQIIIFKTILDFLQHRLNLLFIKSVRYPQIQPMRHVFLTHTNNSILAFSKFLFNFLVIYLSKNEHSNFL